MNVERLSALVYVTDEMIVDYSIGTPEDRAAAAERLAIRQDEARARWLALPIWVRAWRRLQPRLYEYRDRFTTAADVLRGTHDCGYF